MGLSPEFVGFVAWVRHLGSWVRRLGLSLGSCGFCLGLCLCSCGFAAVSTLSLVHGFFFKGEQRKKKKRDWLFGFSMWKSSV